MICAVDHVDLDLIVVKMVELMAFALKLSLHYRLLSSAIVCEMI